MRNVFFCELYLRRTSISVPLLCPTNSSLSAHSVSILVIVVDDKFVDESMNEME